MPDIQTAVQPAAQTDSASEAAQLQADAGDQPLLPPEEGGAGEPAGQESQKPTEDRQPKPEGQPKPAEPPPATPQVPPGYRSEADFRALQSANDRQIAELRGTFNQLVQQLGTQGVEAQVEAARREVRQWLQAQGVNPDEHRGQVESIAQAYRKGIEGDQRAQRAEQDAQQSRLVAVNTVMGAWVHQLAAEHKLDPADVETLQSFYTPESITDRNAMVRTGTMLSDRAKQLGEIRASVAAAKRAKEAEVKPQGFDTAAGAGGMSDDQFLKAYSEGKSNDHARALAIQTRQGVF